MKGIVFTEFMDMVESTYSLNIVDQIISRAHLASGGAYTSVGAYDHEELISLVTELSQMTEIPVPDLVRSFGKYLFKRFTVIYPQFFRGVTEPFEFLFRIESYIHVEVLKLYPDAELPHLVCEIKSETELEMLYTSLRPFYDFAYGLIEGCFEHFNTPVSIEMHHLETEQNKEYRTLFKLTKTL